MHCPFCGNTLSPSARICYNCGHEFHTQLDYKDLEGHGCLGAIAFIFGFLLALLVCWLILGPKFFHVLF